MYLQVQSAVEAEDRAGEAGEGTQSRSREDDLRQQEPSGHGCTVPQTQRGAPHVSVTMRERLSQVMLTAHEHMSCVQAEFYIPTAPEGQ